MKRLVGLGHLAEGQDAEVLELLQRHRIEHRVTPRGIFDPGAIWVAEPDFARAQELLRGESQAFAARMREAWEAEWRTVHRRSAWRWFALRLQEDPAGTLVRLVLLLAALAVFVMLPIWYAIRHAGA